ncbi:hypothetical protein SAMN05216571_101397 [Onishia taeanensis]|uniref:Uncharacterized protein n=1 Tax=Onishia taeanensis TaxID=284577 RepID=A0A1G7NEI0_9GAMM|nr:hypothetical protein SAMN05216571_101397 [Halomonas taeanensis]
MLQHQWLARLYAFLSLFGSLPAFRQAFLIFHWEALLAAVLPIFFFTQAITASGTAVLDQSAVSASSRSSRVSAARAVAVSSLAASKARVRSASAASFRSACCRRHSRVATSAVFSIRAARRSASAASRSAVTVSKCSQPVTAAARPASSSHTQPGTQRMVETISPHPYRHRRPAWLRQAADRGRAHARLLGAAPARPDACRRHIPSGSVRCMPRPPAPH